MVIKMDDWLCKGGLIKLVNTVRIMRTKFFSIKKGVTSMETCGTVLEMKILA